MSFMSVLKWCDSLQNNKSKNIFKNINIKINRVHNQYTGGIFFLNPPVISSVKCPIMVPIGQLAEPGFEANPEGLEGEGVFCFQQQDFSRFF